MPRGADYADGTIQSDNPIEAGENKIAGAPKDGSENVRLFHMFFHPLTMEELLY